MYRVKLPEKIKKISFGLFFCCTNLSEVEMSNVYHIGQLAFCGCTKLSKIVYNGSMEDWRYCCTKDIDWKFGVVWRIRVECEVGTLFEEQN
jgi:hypothetical protein